MSENKINENKKFVDSKNKSKSETKNPFFSLNIDLILSHLEPTEPSPRSVIESIISETKKNGFKNFNTQNEDEYECTESFKLNNNFLGTKNEKPKFVQLQNKNEPKLSGYEHNSDDKYEDDFDKMVEKKIKESLGCLFNLL